MRSRDPARPHSTTACARPAPIRRTHAALAEIGDEAQRSGLEAPDRRQDCPASEDHGVAPRNRLLRQRHDSRPAAAASRRRTSSRILGMRRALGLGPVEHRQAEGLLRRRIGDLPLAVLLGEGFEVRELAPAPVADGARQLRIVREIDEEQEGRRGRPFLAHEEQRDLRREQQRRRARALAAPAAASAEMRSPKARLPIWSWF